MIFGWWAGCMCVSLQLPYSVGHLAPMTLQHLTEFLPWLSRKGFRD